MKRIGILGGTFNPIHIGHLCMAENAYQQFNLDQVLIMPNKNPAYRDIDFNTSEEDRSKMIQLAIESNKHLVFSDFELLRSGPTYTVDTLEILKKQHPDTQYYFIMGADSIFYFEKWRNFERIMELAHIVVAQRSDKTSELVQERIQLFQNQFSCKMDLLNMPNLDISSQEIRTRIEQNQSIQYLVPDSVIKYIKQHQLYENSGII